MSKDLDNLALTYLAVLQGLALGVGQYLLHQIVVIPTTYTHAPRQPPLPCPENSHHCPCPQTAPTAHAPRQHPLPMTEPH